MVVGVELADGIDPAGDTTDAVRQSNESNHVFGVELTPSKRELRSSSSVELSIQKIKHSFHECNNLGNNFCCHGSYHSSKRELHE